MSNESKLSKKQGVLILLTRLSGNERGADTTKFVAAVSKITKSHPSTILQSIKEQRGQVHLRRGRIYVDPDALLTSTTSKISPSIDTQTGSGLRKGKIPGWKWPGRKP